MLLTEVSLDTPVGGFLTHEGFIFVALNAVKINQGSLSPCIKLQSW
jgi:hypothetical protein